MIDLPTAALSMARDLHREQRRKYTNEPYIFHCVEVAALCKAVGCRDEVIAAAYLHDAVEDTECTVGDIFDIFGVDVASLVGMVTDRSKPSDGNRAQRKAIDRAWLSQASPEGKTIKLADLISNTSSIRKHDPKFAKVYLEEKRALLEVLVEGDKTLYDMAMRMVEND